MPAKLSQEKPEMLWSIRSTEIFNENLLYLSFLLEFLWCPSLNKLLRGPVAGKPRVTLPIYVPENLLGPHLLLSVLLKRFKKSNSKKPALTVV